MRCTDPVNLFLSQADLRPHHPAVVEGDGIITYAMMADRVRKLASQLTRFGPHPRVLIHLPQSSWAYVAMLASLMAGGYYAPANLEHPALRQRALFKLFRPDVIVSDKENGNTLYGVGREIPLVTIGHIDALALDVPRAPHELAYVMFTSGTTGTPKGVMIPRSGIAHYVNWAIPAMAVMPEDRWSQHPNIAFDLSVLDIYGALCAGATLYPLLSRQDRLMPARFIRRHRLTIWNSVPSVIDLMQRGPLTVADLDSLRLVTFCGEPLRREHLDILFSKNQELVVHNTYGPTEATVSCTILRLTCNNYSLLCESSAAIGDPIPGMELFLIDGDGQDEGEIVLAGPQLANGYWNDPGATAGNFIQVDVAGRPMRCYRTGDKGFRRSDGALFYSSRLDRQVKLRGHRVELGEIEAVIRSLTGFPAATILCDGVVHGVLECQEPIDFASLRQQLVENLPVDCIPQRFHQIDVLPRNENDKIDYQRLHGFVCEGHV